MLSVAAEREALGEAQVHATLPESAQHVASEVAESEIARIAAGRCRRRAEHALVERSLGRVVTVLPRARRAIRRGSVVRNRGGRARRNLGRGRCTAPTLREFGFGRIDRVQAGLTAAARSPRPGSHRAAPWPGQIPDEAAAEPVRPVEVGQRVVGVDVRGCRPARRSRRSGTSGLPPPAVLPGSAELVSLDRE